MTNIKPQFKGNLGLFLVCAGLSKRNLIAMPTSRNTKGYDVIALDPDTGVATPIQIKCTDQPQKGFAVLSSLWKDYEQKVDDSIMCDFIFVDVSDPDRPSYYVVPQKELRAIVKGKIQEYADGYQKRHGLTWEEVLEAEEKEKRRPNLWAISLNDIRGYADRWDTIVDRLRPIQT